MTGMGFARRSVPIRLLAPKIVRLPPASIAVMRTRYVRGGTGFAGAQWKVCEPRSRFTDCCQIGYGARTVRVTWIWTRAAFERWKRIAAERRGESPPKS